MQWNAFTSSHGRDRGSSSTDGLGCGERVARRENVPSRASAAGASGGSDERGGGRAPDVQPMAGLIDCHAAFHGFFFCGDVFQ